MSSHRVANKRPFLVIIHYKSGRVDMGPKTVNATSPGLAATFGAKHFLIKHGNNRMDKRRIVIWDKAKGTQRMYQVNASGNTKYKKSFKVDAHGHVQ